MITQWVHLQTFRNVFAFENLWSCIWKLYFVNTNYVMSCLWVGIGLQICDSYFRKNINFVSFISICLKRAEETTLDRSQPRKQVSITGIIDPSLCCRIYPEIHKHHHIQDNSNAHAAKLSYFWKNIPLEDQSEIHFKAQGISVF